MSGVTSSSRIGPRLSRRAWAEAAVRCSRISWRLPRHLPDPLDRRRPEDLLAAWVGKCVCRLPWFLEKPRSPPPPGQVRCISLRRVRTVSHSGSGTIRSPSSSWMTHSLSGLSNRRPRPVPGSRRLSVRFQIQRPAYYSLSRIRLTVAGDHPFAERMLPGTFSSLSVRTILVSGSPLAYAVKMRRTTAACSGSISIV